MLNYEYPPIGGGASNATYYILKEFSKIKNLEVDLITSSVSKFKIEKFSTNIFVHRLDIGKNGNLHFQSNKELVIYSWKAYRYAKRIVEKNKYNLVHAIFGIPCGYIAMKLDLPYIVSLRGSDVPFYNKRFEKLDRLFFKRLSYRIWKNAKKVVTNSSGLKELTLRTSPKQEIIVIYNGVDIKEFKPVKKKVSQRIKIISTGRLIERKGFQYLIRALEGLNDFKLELIGGGNLKDELEKLSKELGVPVKFSGKIQHDKISKSIQNGDIFILPSLNEGMSNSVLEAMACGLPVIATDVGGSKELVKGNGFLIPKGNSSGIRNALLKYLKNKKLILKHGLRSRKIAENMSWEKTALSYYRIYKKCAG